jgi:predicted ABC-type transport system involved in lysophospholipase L1 biosynthesis ATPase subunit
VSAPLLEVRGLVKDYLSLRPLRIAALAVSPGDILTIRGLDAQAAEMFVHLATGAALPDTGDVRLFGTSTRDVDDAHAWLRSLDGLGLVSPRAVLVEMFSALQNIAMPLTLDVDPIDAAVRPAVERLARESGLDPDAWDRPIGGADGETVMRVRLARALAQDPRLIVSIPPPISLATGWQASAPSWVLSSGRAAPRWWC